MRRRRTTRPTAMRDRAVARAAAVVTIGIMAGALGAGTTAANPAEAVTPVPRPCPPDWEWPGIGNAPPEYSDYNVATYVGGDFTVQGNSAEAEGRTVVLGTSTFDRTPPALFNLGRVGVGSQVAPPSGAAMFLTGSDLGDDLTLTSTNRLEIGHGIQDGGDVLVAGAVDPSTARIETNGGSVRTGLGADATSAYSDFGARMTALSSSLDQRPTTGVTTVAGNRITFTGNGVQGSDQVFRIDADDLGQSTVELNFVAVPAETAVVVNVTGTAARFNPVWIGDDGERVDYFGHPGFARVAVRTLWNFVDARTLDLAGTSQILGSVLAMTAGNSTRVSASTNGRLYVGGDLTMAGEGNELHNYHWAGSADTACREQDVLPSPHLGEVRVTKAVVGDQSLLPGDLEFVGLIECPLADGSTVSERWRVRPGGTYLLEHLPVGTRCTVSEAEPLPAEGGPVWADPVLSPVDGVVTVPDPADPAAQVTVTVTNTPLAAFDVTKHVVGPDGTDAGFANPGRTFAVDYHCVLSQSDVDGTDPATGAPVPGSARGTFAIRAGETTSSLLFPLGTVCTLRENLVSEPGDFSDPGGHWTEISFAPSSRLTVGDPEASSGVTVRDVFETAAAPLGRFAVDKVVVGPGGEGDPGFVNTGRTFAVDYACTLDGHPSIGYDPANPTEVVAPDGTGRLDVAAGASASSPAFAAGTVCVLSEDLVSNVGGPDFEDPSGHWTQAEFMPSRSVTISDETVPVSVRLVNRFATVAEPLGSFAVRKSVSGPDGEESGFANRDRDFFVDFACTVDGRAAIGYDPLDPTVVVAPQGTGTLVVRADRTPVGSPLFPTGAVCELEEDLTPLYDDFLDSSYSWTGARFTPSNTVTIGADGSVAQVDLVNTFDRDEPGPELGRLELTKAVEGPFGAHGPGLVTLDRVFDVDFACELDGAPAVGVDDDGHVTAPDGTGSVAVGLAGARRTPWFEFGTQCFLAERLRAADGDFVDPGAFEWLRTVIYPGNPVVVGRDGAAVIDVRVTNVFTGREEPPAGPGAGPGSGRPGDHVPPGAGPRGGGPLASTGVIAVFPLLVFALALATAGVLLRRRSAALRDRRP